ncbi:MAG: exodeoxyribonuclease VII large subunit [Spongiibacteraceae bacterium]|nr:exodeoxyribonuclease VII large subunit [Spongiibacteraceae bacterium]
MQTKTTAKRDTLSISQLNRQAKRLLEGNFPNVWVEGEISNLSRPSSGHWYFTLKDAGAQVRCAMFRSSNARLRFGVEAGQQITARAKLSLYEARGDYQLIVEHMEPAGDGALAKAFEALKNKLHTQGLFDPARKKALPSFIRHIAVVTSPTGAAIKHILAVLARRFPAIEVTIFPTQVQGREAAQQIAQAIDNANLLSGDNYHFDVILIGRGGGSLEDLWPFNEEILAHSISNSELPIVSAVGHEVDVSISDFVADVRAATPSAAAELLSPDQREWFETLAGYEHLLLKLIRSQLTEQQGQLDLLRVKLKHPGSRLQEHSQRLDDLEYRLLNSWKNRLRNDQHRVALLKARLRQQSPKHAIEQLQLTISNYRLRLQQQIQHRLEQHKTKLQSVLQILNTVNPLATLERGYAIVNDNNAHVVTDSQNLQLGQTLNTRLSKGSVTSKVIHLTHTNK